MSTELALIPAIDRAPDVSDPPALPAVPAASPGPTGHDVVAALLAGRNERTRVGYARDLADFARHRLAESPGQAIEALLSSGQGAANGVALDYRNAQLARGLASATIVRRLAVLRSAVKMAGRLGRVGWTLDVEGPRVEARRDVRGPDGDGWRKVWKAARAAGDGPKAARDRALLSLLFDLALRRSEVVALDLDSLDLAGGTVSVVGKGKREAVPLTLPDPTRRALGAWVAIRGDGAGPLFPRITREGRRGGRLTGDGLNKAVGAIGRAAGLARPLRPHGLRHSAITAALDAGCDVRKVRLFSRHAKIETVIRYDDARQDAGGEVARRVAGKRK